MFICFSVYQLIYCWGKDGIQSWSFINCLLCLKQYVLHCFSNAQHFHFFVYNHVCRWTRWKAMKGLACVSLYKGKWKRQFCTHLNVNMQTDDFFFFDSIDDDPISEGTVQQWWRSQIDYMCTLVNLVKLLKCSNINIKIIRELKENLSSSASDLAKRKVCHLMAQLFNVLNPADAFESFFNN